MYKAALKFVVPCLLSSNSEFIIAAGLIFGMITAFVIWGVIAEFLAKVLNCDEIIDKFIDTEEK